MPVRVAAAQLALGRGSYSKSVEHALSLIEQAAELDAQIVCLPEHWLLEYPEQGDGGIQKIVGISKSKHVFVVTGANYTPIENGERRIRSYLIGPEGQVMGHQDKIHLFRGEKNAAKPGDSYEIFETALGKIGILVCYDNVFPEAARTLVLKGADVLFVPSRIISEGVDPWILYLRTRTLENRVPVVAPNIFDPPRYLGGSVIVDLVVNNSVNVVFPRIAASARSGECVIYADIDIDRARELRKERLSDRRPSAYTGFSS